MRIKEAMAEETGSDKIPHSFIDEMIGMPGILWYMGGKQRNNLMTYIYSECHKGP